MHPQKFLTLGGAYHSGAAIYLLGNGKFSLARLHSVKVKAENVAAGSSGGFGEIQFTKLYIAAVPQILPVEGFLRN